MDFLVLDGFFHPLKNWPEQLSLIFEPKMINTFNIKSTEELLPSKIFICFGSGNSLYLERKVVSPVKLSSVPITKNLGLSMWASSKRCPSNIKVRGPKG